MNKEIYTLNVAITVDDKGVPTRDGFDAKALTNSGLKVLFEKIIASSITGVGGIDPFKETCDLIMNNQLTGEDTFALLLGGLIDYTKDMVTALGGRYEVKRSGEKKAPLFKEATKKSNYEGISEEEISLLKPLFRTTCPFAAFGTEEPPTCNKEMSVVACNACKTSENYRENKGNV